MSKFPKHKHIFWLVRVVRDMVGHRPDHNGSENFYDFFGCFPYNDNDVKRERRDSWRWLVKGLSYHSFAALDLLAFMNAADRKKAWR